MLRIVWRSYLLRRGKSCSNQLRMASKLTDDGNSGGEFKVGLPPANSSKVAKVAISELVVPVDVKAANNPDDIAVVEDMGGAIKREKIVPILNALMKMPEILQLAEEHGMNLKLFQQAFISFRRYCFDSNPLPMGLHIVLNDIIHKSSTAHISDLFPYFLEHAKLVFPHLGCLDDLRQISDLRLPRNWYPEARSIQRKIIFHSGPTNSGKTYHALQRFMNSKSGVYCCPLKLLASEVFHKTNDAGLPCDLITGEERRYAKADGMPCDHVACTVEMLNTAAPYEVAIIDEIQMVRDFQRGWAWTRALLGVYAEEVHVCGEGAAVDLVKELLADAGEEVEVRNYKRMTPLTVLDQAVGSFDQILPGDCIVCFSKNDIFTISRQLERINREVSVIYGGLPPGTKLAQAKKFNDPQDPCKILVATDAVGMGLNLSIKRLVFYSLMKPTTTETGDKEMELITTSQALQVAGRAGRFKTQFEEGEVTTFHHGDLPTLKKLLRQPVEPIAQAGLYPTIDQVELFSYHLPNASLSNLLDIFVTICSVEDNFFMCNLEDFKFLADAIQHVPITLRTRYQFCLAPVNRRHPFVCTMFLKLARRFSENEPLTFDWLCRSIGWPFTPPEKLNDLVHLEGVFDVLDTYLWLGYRFPDMFPDMQLVRDMQQELDLVIQEGVSNITKLLARSENRVSSRIAQSDVESAEFDRKARQARFNKGRVTSDLSDEDNLPKVQSATLRKLLADGTLTPRQVAQLQAELGRSSKHGRQTQLQSRKTPKHYQGSWDTKQ